ncbi:MAG TPA: c-type cytochrome, partial [Isosphaeraceae bacterium]|nr:c-type cytochrome [Isosphaeraceae bacterium]
GTIPRRDLSATTARQLQAYADPVIDTRLAKVWGTLRPTSREKAALVTKYKALLANGSAAADAGRGRLVFNRTCLQCHRLYDAGGDVGPDLTGSDRANADYILENVLDPSASVGRDFQLTTVATTDGRLISGIVREQTPRTFTLQTINERVVVDRQDVDEMKTSPASMMPEGLLEKLSDTEVRDLFAYLSSKAQVTVPAEKTGP